MIKKTRIVLCLIIIIIVSVFCLNFFFKYIRPIDITKVDKITIRRFPPEVAIGSESIISDRAEIGYIIGKINSLRYRRKIQMPQRRCHCLPDVYIIVYFREDDDVFILAMNNTSNNVFYCYTVRNGRRRGRFLIDGEELYNFAIDSLEQDGYF